MDHREPPNFYGNGYPSQFRNGPDMAGYGNPYMNPPDYPVPGQEKKEGEAGRPTADSACMTELCKLNRGKAVTVYCTFTDSAEWRDKVFKGILYSASDDNIIIYNQNDGKFTIIVAVYVDFVEFYDLAVLDTPKEGMPTAKNPKAD